MKIFKKQDKNKTQMDYFNEAKSWADDMYGNVEQSRNRYKCAFLGAMLVNGLALIAVASLAQIQTLVPLMIHHFDNGVVTVEPLKSGNAPLNKAQVESDIIRYITTRESYDVSSYRSQYNLITQLSDEVVLTEFGQEQDKSSKESPINSLGATGERLVHVYSINFIDNSVFNETAIPKDHHNLAEVVFTLTDKDKLTGHQTEKHFNALISWEYTTPSKAPDVRWNNWDGFMVTRYSKQLRNI
ncbi:MAG: type IV secretion system protein [Legionella sp.]|nr:type IV secretion system protein [Legionella sp.]